MFSTDIVERRVIFRPYSSVGSRKDVYVCVSCGMHFSNNGDMGDLTTRFAEHVCEPVFLDVEEERRTAASRH